MIILNLMARDVDAVMSTGMNRINIYRAAAQEGPFDSRIGQVILQPSVESYEFVDPSGTSAYWYSSSYFNTANDDESEKAAPVRGVSAEGPLGLITISQLRAMTDFSTIASLPDSRVAALIWRAETLIQNYANRHCGLNTGIPGFEQTAALLTQMIAEEIYLRTTPSMRTAQVSGMKSEKIGSYQYTKFDAPKVESQKTTDNGLTYEMMSLLRGIVGCPSGGLQMTTTWVFKELQAMPVAGTQMEVRPWWDGVDQELYPAFTDSRDPSV